MWPGDAGKGTVRASRREKAMSVFQFVFRSSYYSGKLPGLVATYLSFLLLGFTPVAIIFYKGLYFSALAGSSRSAFLVANAFFIGCLLFRVSYDILICRRAGQFAYKQSTICQKALLAMQVELRSAKQSLYSDRQDKIYEKYAGDHILDNGEMMYQSLNTFIQSSVQSFFSVASTMITIFLMGYGKLGLISCSIAMTIIACNYHIQKNLVAKQQVTVKNLKVDARKMIQERFSQNRAAAKGDHAVLDTYVKESNSLLDYDALRNWTYIFIKYTTEAVIMMVAVLVITQTFPLEMNSIGSSALNITIMMNLCQILASTIMDSSAIIRDFDKYAHAVSSYNNLCAQMRVLHQDQGVILRRFHPVYYEGSMQVNKIGDSLVGALQAAKVGLCALVAYTSMLDSGLIQGVSPFGLTAIGLCKVLLALVAAGYFLPGQMGDQAEGRSDKVFLGLTGGALVCAAAFSLGQTHPLWLLVCYLISNVSIINLANSVMIPQAGSLRVSQRREKTVTKDDITSAAHTKSGYGHGLRASNGKGNHDAGTIEPRRGFR